MTTASEQVFSQDFASKIYTGWVGHRRFTPTTNAFKYKVFMMYIDLDELDSLFKLSAFWGASPWCLARFKRNDFLGDVNTPLKLSVKNTVFNALGVLPQGPIRMLANLRYFGYSVNPLTTYYCFDKTGEHLEYIVADVKNTPWRERHAYVLPVNGVDDFECEFNKAFHVSPFNPLDMNYCWQSNTPAQTLRIHLENWRLGKKIMDASVGLTAIPVTAKNLNAAIFKYPLMTFKVIAAIYWQALKLAIKKTPVYGHSTSAEH